MKSILKILVAISWGVLFTQCASNETANSDAVKQSEIFQQYSVGYNMAERELTATATFRFGGANGTTLLLVKPSSVLFENQAMPNETNVFSGTYYEMNFQTGIKPGYQFVYTDGDGKSYVNRALIIPAEITSAPKLIDKNEGFSVSWDYPLQNGESIHLFVEDKTGNTATVYYNAVGSTTMKMNPAELKNLKTGEVHVFLVRENISALENAAHLGGSMFVKYTSNKIGTQLIGTVPVTEEKKDSVAG
jgi:hypothetical protein